jgi:hypothetical protein
MPFWALRLAGVIMSTIASLFFYTSISLVWRDLLCGVASVDDPGECE